MSQMSGIGAPESFCIKANVKASSKIIDDKCTDKSIANNFQTIYESLYNSVKDDNLCNTKSKIDNLVNSKCNSNSCGINCHNVSGDIIRNAIKCLDNGKDDEVYNVFSDNFYMQQTFFVKFLPF